MQLATVLKRSATNNKQTNSHIVMPLEKCFTQGFWFKAQNHNIFDKQNYKQLICRGGSRNQGRQGIIILQPPLLTSQLDCQLITLQLGYHFLKSLVCLNNITIQLTISFSSCICTTSRNNTDISIYTAINNIQQVASMCLCINYVTSYLAISQFINTK